MSEGRKPLASLWSRRLILGGGVATVTGVGALGYLATRRGAAVIHPGRARALAVDSDTQFPAQVDAVVIGGGIVGTTAALSLAERGLKVALFEKGVIAGEASGRSLGYVDGQFLDPVKMPIIARSKELWAGLNARTEAETGYRRRGQATSFSSDEGVEAAKAWLSAVSGAPGVDAVLLGSKDAARFSAGGVDKIAGALFQPSDGVAEPELAAPAVAGQVRRLGGIVMQNCAVRGLEFSGGKVSAVVTEKGTVKCSAAVLAGGVWSPVMAKSLDLDLPQFMAFGSVIRFSEVDGPEVSTVAAERNLVMRRNWRGGYDLCIGSGIAPITPDALWNLNRLRPAMRKMWSQIDPVLNLATFMEQASIPRHWALDAISPFEKNRVFMPEIGSHVLEKLLAQLPATFPFLASAKPVDRWAGSLMSTPDNMPVISPVERYPGLFVGSGFYYGLTMGPAAGEALADLVTGQSPKFDLSLYRLERFSERAPIEFRA